MGWIIAMGACFVCKRPFTFNPARVPSTPPNVHPTREPICGSCMERINQERTARDLEPFPIHPDAYEPCDEAEVGV